MHKQSDRGTAMLLALLALIIVSGISLFIISLIYKGFLTSGYVVKRAQNSAIIEGAIHAAIPILYVDGSDNHNRENTGTFTVTISGTPIEVRIVDACTKWDLNEGDLGILQSLLQELKVPKPDLFLKLIQEIRESTDGFQHVNQLRAIPGLTTRNMNNLIAETTIYCRSHGIENKFASTLMRKALKSLSTEHHFEAPGRVFQISASNALGPGTYLSATAYIEIAEAADDFPKILDWRLSDQSSLNALD
ncbi:MAG: hypothetical protein CMM58_03420 [Rhodospirillaceae bacterium]|nr:hypothetical protein [Rhodospirillaceae bacterium]|tara:strand:- start:870 stop:1613 length:744 start_codon:yes stop_codon:yes gene_type:complete